MRRRRRSRLDLRRAKGFGFALSEWFNGPVVGLHLCAVHHLGHGLAAVEKATPAVPGLGARVVAASDAVRGAIVLATCNRVEVYVDSDARPDAVAEIVRGALRDGLEEPVTVPLIVLSGTAALTHLFQVGASLDSMVVGEREIAGQLRGALKLAHRDGLATGLLTDSVEQALRTARKVTGQTRLGATGRSVVSVGLDLLSRDWSSTRVLIVGTGSYAGRVVTDLKRRGCAHIDVHSASGRAMAFAASHDVSVASHTLVEALADADVVVTCRGTGVILDVGMVSEALAGREKRPLMIVDLAITRDVDPGVGSLDDVILLDLSTIQRHLPDMTQSEVQRAREIVDTGVLEMVNRLKGREMSPAVVALRDVVNDMLTDEVERLPQGRLITREEAAHALSRLAARLVHVPSVRARKAAEEGRQDEYLAALSELWGLAPQVRSPLDNLELGSGPSAAAAPPETLESDVCPATGLSLADLGPVERREAM